MIYFYGFAFLTIFESLIVTVTGLAKPNRITMCGFQIGMLLVVLSDLLKSLQ